MKRTRPKVKPKMTAETMAELASLQADIMLMCADMSVDILNDQYATEMQKSYAFSLIVKLMSKIKSGGKS